MSLIRLQNMSTHKSPSYIYILAMNTWKPKKKKIVKLTVVAKNEKLRYWYNKMHRICMLKTTNADEKKSKT